MGESPMDSAYVTKFNETYNDRIHKYTLNVPLEVWEELKKRTSSGQEIRRISIYINAVLSQHIKNERPIGMDILLDAIQKSNRAANAEIRREKLNSIEQNPSKNKPGWVKLKIRKAFNIFNPKQDIFDFRKNNS